MQLGQHQSMQIQRVWRSDAVRCDVIGSRPCLCNTFFLLVRLVVLCLSITCTGLYSALHATLDYLCCAESAAEREIKGD